MSEIKRISLSADAELDPWLGLGEEQASDLLQHLRSDNAALRRLRDALSADLDTSPPFEPVHA